MGDLTVAQTVGLTVDSRAVATACRLAANWVAARGVPRAVSLVLHLAARWAEN